MVRERENRGESGETYLEGGEDEDPTNLAHHVIVARLNHGHCAGKDIVLHRSVEAVERGTVDGVAELPLPCQQPNARFVTYGVPPCLLGPDAYLVQSLPDAAAHILDQFRVRLDAGQEVLGIARRL
jgi:hypothetical protein